MTVNRTTVIETAADFVFVTAGVLTVLLSGTAAWAAWTFYAQPELLALVPYGGWLGAALGGLVVALGLIPTGIALLAGLYAATEIVQLGDQE